MDDAGTALGPSRRELWEVYGGMYTARVDRVRRTSALQERLEEGVLEIGLEPGAEAQPESTECTRVFASVLVRLREPDSELDAAVEGVLSWTEGRGVVEFDSARSRGDSWPRIVGVLDFDPEEGLRVGVRVYTKAAELTLRHE